MPQRRHGRSIRLRAAWVLALLLSACGARFEAMDDKARVRPFTALDDSAFDSSVELIADPRSLEGEWREGWERDLRTLTTRADLIVVGRIDAVFTEMGPEQVRRFRLVFRGKRVLWGDAPEHPLLQLWASPEQNGFGSLGDQEGSITSTDWIVFLRFKANARGKVEGRWRLARASNYNIERTDWLLKHERRKTRRQGDQEVRTVFSSASGKSG